MGAIEEFEHLAWSSGARRFRGADGAVYTLVLQRGMTGRLHGAVLTSESGKKWKADRKELLGTRGARFSLPCGQRLDVRVTGGVDEDLYVDLDGEPCPFLPAEAMSVDAFAREVKKTSRARMTGAWLLGLVGLPTLFAGVHMLVHGRWEGWIALLFGALFVLFANLQLVEALDRRKGPASRIVRVLVDAPSTVRAIYPKVTKSAFQLVKGGSYVLVVVTKGRIFEVELAPETIEPALRLFESRAPEAIVGAVAIAHDAVEPDDP